MHSILLADDHRARRRALRALLAGATDFQIVGEAADGLAAVRGARELAPDIVLMDVVMPGINGIEATRRILAAGLPVRVLAISMQEDPSFVAAMLDAGAAGYLLLDDAAEELIEAVRTVAAGGRYLSRRLDGASRGARSVP